MLSLLNTDRGVAKLRPLLWLVELREHINGARWLAKMMKISQASVSWTGNILGFSGLWDLTRKKSQTEKSQKTRVFLFVFFWEKIFKTIFGMSGKSHPDSPVPTVYNYKKNIDTQGSSNCKFLLCRSRPVNSAVAASFTK